MCKVATPDGDFIPYEIYRMEDDGNGNFKVITNFEGKTIVAHVRQLQFDKYFTTYDEREIT